jgi:hypothetical protein
MKRIASTFGAIRQNWKMTQKVYPALPLEVLGLALAAFIVVFIPVLLFVNWLSALLIALPMGLLAGVYWFSRRAMRAAYAQVEGQAGAAAAVVQSFRTGSWAVTPGVAVNRNQDLISRVVGKPGVILISEGPASRVVPMLTAERKKTARWVPEVPIYEIQVGREEGQVQLAKLQRALNKLPKNLRGGEITDVRRRLEAVSQTPLAMPKGPMPTSTRQVRGRRNR